MIFSEKFGDQELCQGLLNRLRKEMDAHAAPVRFMEVCGTHTVAIFQSGLRSLLPEGLTHLSGPGCPVCVTHDSEISMVLELAEKNDVILTTFGDLMRVPGPDGRSMKHAQADGARIKVVYSPLDAVQLAVDNPAATVVFVAVGFETTAPAVGGAILSARQKGLDNFCILSCHKLVPPALQALLDDENGFGTQIDAFLLPGHVAVITGLEPFRFIARNYKCPAVVSGFEPADILSSLCMMLEQIRENKPEVGNTYKRVVDPAGNPAAQALLTQVFCVRDTRWRGLGIIPVSGLGLNHEFENFDAFRRFDLHLGETRSKTGCRCGQVLAGAINPPQCPLFGKVCTPQNPTGPCMVSTEGSCAAWYKYQAAE